MPEILTRDFGPVTCSPEDIFEFPLGLVGFPESRRFLALRPQPDEPLVVLQSLERRDTAFLTIPVQALVPGYEVRMVENDARVLGDPAAGNAGAACDVLVLLSLPAEGTATANLLGPVVLNRSSRRGVQAIRDDRRYGAAEPLEALLAAASGMAADCGMAVVSEPKAEALCS